MIALLPLRYDYSLTYIFGLRHMHSTSCIDSVWCNHAAAAAAAVHTTYTRKKKKKFTVRPIPRNYITVNQFRFLARQLARSLSMSPIVFADYCFLLFFLFLFFIRSFYFSFIFTFVRSTTTSVAHCRRRWMRFPCCCVLRNSSTFRTYCCYYYYF